MLSVELESNSAVLFTDYDAMRDVLMFTSLRYWGQNRWIHVIYMYVAMAANSRVVYYLHPYGSSALFL